MQTISNTPTHRLFFLIPVLCLSLPAFPACSSSSSWYGEHTRQEQRGQYPTQYAYLCDWAFRICISFSTLLSISISVNTTKASCFSLIPFPFSDRHKIGKAARAAGQRRRVFMLRLQSTFLCRVSYRRSFKRS